jgi:iron complex transport system permease protein
LTKEPTLPWTRRHWRLTLGFALLGAIVVAVLSIGAGAVPIEPDRVVVALWQMVSAPRAQADGQDLVILREIRLPRVLLAALAGGALATCGVLMQAFFRNPLADPALIGVATGGALGAVAVIVLGASVLSGLTAVLATFALPVAAFFGSLFTTMAIFLLSRREGVVDATGMLLAGIAVNAIAGAGIGLLTFLATDTQLRNLTFWSLGSLSASGWGHVQVVAVASLVLLLALPFLVKPLNALLLGDSEARHLGVDVERLKAVLLVLTSLSAGAVVATCGVVGFVGLIAPHFARLLVGPDHRAQLPLAALLGSALMCFADTIARTAVAPAELPLGVLTALAGGPLFLWMLSRRRGTAFHA